MKIGQYKNGKPWRGKKYSYDKNGVPTETYIDKSKE